MPEYLMHFNRNHDKRGRFTFGDGDGDGIPNDHAHRSLSERYGEAVDRHRSKVMNTESYRTNRDSLRLKQAQMANQKHAAKTDIKNRNLNYGTQKVQTQVSKEQLRNRMAEEKLQSQAARDQLKNRAAIEREKARAELSNERTAALEAKTREKAAREALRQQILTERNQQKADKLQLKAEKAQQKMEKDRLKAEKKEYQRMVDEQKKYRQEVKRQEARLKAEYKKMNKREEQKGRMRTAAVVAAVSGMPITSLRLLAGSVGDKNRGRSIISSALLNPAASVYTLGKGIKEDIDTLRNFKQ